MAKPSHTPRDRSASRGSGAPGDQRDFAPGRRGRRGRRRGLKIAGLVTGFVVVVAGVGGVWAYEKLNGNIKSDDLYAGKGGDTLHEKADAFGRTPINILVIGSDSRTDKADCAIGGACQGGDGGARADVEMVLHISADRSNATVLSIPRDLETALPACTDDDNHTSVGPRTDMINSALGYSPGCSVLAVQQLTGIPIDHFMMVDFSGVVNMADAVGGVHICVDHNIYDPYSHLKLKSGGHTLQGVAALEFLRTRHGFGGGTDTGRTVAQHRYLTSLINKLKSAGTLTDPAAVWKLATAATKSLTVDGGPNGIGSIGKLTGLAQDVNKVPADRITFTTMQTYDDPDPDESGRLLAAPNAQTLFKAIADDQSLTTAGGGKSAAAASATAIPTGGIAVHVENGTLAPGRAGGIRTALVADGFSPASTAGNGPSASTTTLTYPAGQQPQAKAVAGALGLPSAALKQGTGAGFTLLVGADWPTGTAFPGHRGTPAPVDTAAALGGASQQNGGDTGKCAQVGTADTLIGATATGRITTAPTPYGMSPEHAYAISPDVPDSAP
ncbi:LCP family protein [Streptomyces sp. SL13]|jgi:LCP family protein required for cell wall assembly|uniref:LCP family protein n=1 Tax=Streptantibioticus silvisoli TaxID=2705255 RepID=A0AA90H699_9ACTN|nr:LCP family protein [Streptantibioticus silvisoli]MDI5966781.1 LCP family protein [Streptantibioticus silvisoli]MDI5971207.1 LCP family protein [Streptantibioticus silvisoli]